MIIILQKFAGLNLCDPVYFRGKVTEIEVTKVFLSGFSMKSEY